MEGMKEHQPDEEEIQEGDLDEDTVEPTVDPLESKGRINHIQCKDEDLGSGSTEEEAIYEEKEGDWGTGTVLGGPSQAPESLPQREQEANPAVEWGN